MAKEYTQQELKELITGAKALKKELLEKKELIGVLESAHI